MSQAEETFFKTMSPVDKRLFADGASLEEAVTSRLDRHLQQVLQEPKMLKAFRADLVMGLTIFDEHHQIDQAIGCAARIQFIDSCGVVLEALERGEHAFYLPNHYVILDLGFEYIQKHQDLDQEMLTYLLMQSYVAIRPVLSYVYEDLDGFLSMLKVYSRNLERKEPRSKLHVLTDYFPMRKNWDLDFLQQQGYMLI